ncbi:MAG: hypothetical protein H6624_13495 [Bdellovibrionaceae bacterium]|nr:hypothetical protein [Bdellovibrionales bacterium]MCB9085357.1 hypothetical protein [Pseudobdellovibrionaceae bacterium]
MNQLRRKIQKSEKGIITVDFLFAFTLVMGFGALMFSLALTLTVVEVTQYITFASARTYYASHIAPPAQEALAAQKYAELTTNNTFGPLFTNGWFSIENPPNIGDLSQLFPDYQPTNAGDPNLFWGVGTTFVARMLDFRIPFYGSTTSEGDGSGDGFTTFVGSYLGREVTTNECINFSRDRWKAVRTLPGGGVGYGTNTSDAGYVTFTDNGC